MINLLFVAIILLLNLTNCTQSNEALQDTHAVDKIDVVLQNKWSPQQAHLWCEARQWISGANFITSAVVNQLEMWQEDTFDPETIDRELGYAEEIGSMTFSEKMAHHTGKRR